MHEAQKEVPGYVGGCTETEKAINRSDSDASIFLKRRSPSGVIAVQDDEGFNFSIVLARAPRQIQDCVNRGCAVKQVLKPPRIVSAKRSRGLSGHRGSLVQ